MRRRLLAAGVATALLCASCSSPDVLTGRGTTVLIAAGGTSTPSTAPSAAPASVLPSAAPSAGPSSSASSTVDAAQALSRRLRDAAASTWTRINDPRTATSFALPGRVTPTTRLQNGVSQRLYTYQLTKQSGVSVGYIRLGSPAAAEAALRVYPSQLQRSFRAIGVDDAAVTERATIDVVGHPGVAFRFAFTPTTPPQIKPVWLIDIVASGADLVLLQTIVFPATLSYDYLTPARQVQHKLMDSLRVPG